MRPSKLALILLPFLILAACLPVHTPAVPTVILHPDGALYVGDQVSFEVLSTDPAGQKEGSIEVSFDGRSLGRASYAPSGVGRRNQAALWWVWDTRDLEAGRYNLTFTRTPDNLTWTESVTLQPASRLPDPGAHWATVITACCNIHYITGTAAERDLSILGGKADEQSADVIQQLGSQAGERIELVLMPRVIGQGGFTSNEVYITYLDRDYVSNNMSILFHHEFVHYYSATLGGGYLPAILAEGLAVYLSGGHFKPEPLRARAAALLDLGWYIPLESIADDFYTRQHEIGYLEAAALVEYLVDTYGWEAFKQFYLSIPQPEDQTVATVMDAALRDHFGISLADLETAYLAYLRAQPFTDDERTDLQLTVEYFDAVRRYQQALDPSAYFMTAWLPDAAIMRQRNIVADLLRHPNGWDNRLVESLLIGTRQRLFDGNYIGAARSLKWVDLFLDGIVR